MLACTLSTCCLSEPHVVVVAGLAHHLESQPLIQPARTFVRLEYREHDATPARLRRIHERLSNVSADALALVLWGDAERVDLNVGMSFRAHREADVRKAVSEDVAARVVISLILLASSSVALTSSIQT